jgi:glyoxylase-like metal-dependent hydrolase (beta-lactamase superfamily II)
MATVWQQLSDHAWLVPGAVNSAVLEHEGRAVLIDTGADRDAGKRLVRGLRERSWRLEAIVTTHAHADHVGGHAAVLRQLDVPVYAPAIEAELMRAPSLEPIYLFHGAAPLPELTSRWLQAEPSRVDVVAEAGPLELIGLPLELIEVDGHAIRQLAVRVDDVLIAGDAVFGDAIAARYPLLFAHDVALQRRSAERIGGDAARLALPGHGDPAPPRHLADVTIKAIDAAHAALRNALAARPDGAETGAVVRAVAAELGAQMDDLPRWHLNHTTVCAYLAAARAAGEADVRIDDGVLRWFARPA